ncbi:MAG: hypothetical protein KJO07_22990, partial [Deltaproteobacteria bacterium]|nr:hypothetical protein [Deltaproteobacteria bacterium]
HKKVGQPKSDKPKSDKPKSDRPKSDRPKTDKPKTDHRKPITKEPKPKKAPSLPERAELGDTGSRAQVMQAVEEPKDSKAEPKVVVDDKDKDKDKPKKGKKKRGLLRRDKKPKETKKGAASGSKPPDKKEPRGGSPGGGWSRRRWVTTLVILVAVAGIGTLSYLNSQRYYFVCHSKKITAERGRLFPLGQTELDGDEWRAISIDPAFDCKDSEVGSEDALAEKFAQVLLERADDSLGQEDADVDEIDKQLSQALLLTRGGKSRRKRVERLRGDVAYRRALASVQEARASLETAAKTFDDAATKRPIHASDASGWSKFAAEIGKRLDRGPHDLCPDCAEAGLSVPPVAIPGPPDGPATPAQPGGQNPDAGVPASGPDAAPPSRGGVLL